MNKTADIMRAVLLAPKLRVVADYPRPRVAPGMALIRVQQAGICGTDLELARGYQNFVGVPGHEFTGVVAACDDEARIGQAVVAAINTACGRCAWCARGLPRHCAHRRTLGIHGLDGCMADYCLVPGDNLCALPPQVPPAKAIFSEPLAAAARILEQVQLTGTERVLVLGDGRLGILCAWVLTTAVSDVTLIGRHPQKLARAKWRQLKTALDTDLVAGGADVVVDATGAADGLTSAMALCRPQGVVVLKTTLAAPVELRLAALVVNEQTLIGSRCGHLPSGLAMIQACPDMPLESLITARYPLERAAAAFEHAARPEALKILIDLNDAKGS